MISIGVITPYGAAGADVELHDSAGDQATTRVARVVSSRGKRSRPRPRPGCAPSPGPTCSTRRWPGSGRRRFGAAAPHHVIAWASSHVKPDVDAVFLGGNGFRAAGAIEALGERLGCLVLESNQVLLWSALAETDTSAELPGCGSLLDTLSPTGAADR